MAMMPQGLGGVLGSMLGGTPAPAMKPGFMAPGSKGAIIAGILGDALATASGGRAQFIPGEMQRRQQEQQASAAEAQWHKQRMAGREDKQWEWANKPTEAPVAPMMQRELEYWRSLDAEGQAAYRSMQSAKPQFIPDGMGGGQWATPPAAGAMPTAPMRPVGPLVPISGGPASAPGSFRP